MATAGLAVSDLLVTTKSREVQRAEAAEAKGDSASAARHFLAAAHLEFVLTNDYADAGRPDLSVRSRIGAASCLWRAGEFRRARQVLEELMSANGENASTVLEVLADLQARFPEPS
jgi:hypothetical protein